MLLEVFNLDRAIKEPEDEPLIIVEGFFDVIKLHQHGCKKVVALMGWFMSPTQEELIRTHANSYIPASELEMKDAPPTAKEYKVIALRECPLPEQMQICEEPQQAADYWRLNIATNPYFNPDCECFGVLMLNTRHRVKGHQLVTIGTIDTLLVHPREVFRGAVIAGAAAIVLMHNHPSGEATPSEADIKVTRDLI
jgi:DNA repair protein RadC